MKQLHLVAEKIVDRAEATVVALPASRSRLLVKLDSDGAPVLLDREYDRLERLCVWIPDKGPCELARALTPAERDRIEVRAAALEQALQPFTSEDRCTVKVTVAAMFGGFRAMRQQGEDAEAVVEITVAVLREFPAWAIAKACLLIAQGRAGLDRRFAPNDSEIYDVVRGFVSTYAKAFESAQRLLSAVAPSTRTPEEQARADAQVAEARKLLPPTQERRPPPLPGDGKHGQRIAADLARRAARNAARNSASSNE